MTFNAVKEFTYLKGFAMGRNMNETIKALNFSRKMHSEQKRKDGSPYIVHPLTMACHAISIGIYDDAIIASILYHDICEDCNISVDELPTSDEVKAIVKLVTKTSDTNDDEYYEQISHNLKAIIVKLIDRCHNVSSMAGVFSRKKLIEYIEETRKYTPILIRVGKNNYPEYSNFFFIIKYHINSVVDAIDATLSIQD